MTFTHPEFLWGFTALSIPIFYHLFQLRKFQKVYFSDVRFLTQVQQKSARRKKIEHWVTLLLRLLAISFMVLAFSGPTFDEGQESSSKVVFALDLSPSMNVSELETPLYLRAIADARSVVESFPMDANFRVMGHPESPYGAEDLTQRDVLNLLNKTSGAQFNHPFTPPSLSGNYQLFVFSDFQRTQNWEALLEDSLCQKAYLFNYAPGDSTPNTYIDSIWFDSPESHLNTRQSLTVKLKKQPASEEDNAPIEIFINGAQQSVATAEFDTRGDAEVVFDIFHSEAGWMAGEVVVLDEVYPMDNSTYFSYQVKEEYHILHLYANKPFEKLEKVFAAEEMKYLRMEQNQANSRDIDLADLIIVEEANQLSSGLISEIEEAVNNGAHVLLMESSAASSGGNSVTRAFGGPSSYVYKGVTPLNIEAKDPFYTGVFSIDPEPTTGLEFESSRTMQPPFSEAYPLYLDALGNAWASRWSLGEGVVIWLGNTPSELSAAQLNSDWFPVFFSRSLLYSERNAPLYLSSASAAGFPLNAPLASDDNPIQLADSKGNSWIPLQRSTGKYTQLFLPPGWDQSGLYRATTGNDTLGVVAINHPSEESDLSYFSEDEITSDRAIWVRGDQKAEAYAKESSWNSSIWKYCLIFALLFLIIEALYTRLR
ncbi:MAG: BatA and WFA domain-containing protein [Schleiferiaceae bacterium]